MPASAACDRPAELTERISAGALAAAAPAPGEVESLLKALRDLKNQIIGNRTKKIAFLSRGAVPRLVAVLSAAASSPSPDAAPLIVQCAAALGSFACGVDAGVRAVVDAGAVPCLTGILSHPDEKVVDAVSRSLRIIFQSKLAPKFDILLDKNMRFLLSLLNSVNENVTELAASIITHSCESTIEQKALCEAGVLRRLFTLLDGSLNQRDACLESIAALVNNNSEVVSEFVAIGSGKALSSIIGMMNDRNPRTRLLACVCLIIIGKSSCYIQELEIQTKLILILLELLVEPGRVGDDAPFVLVSLIKDKVELHKQACSVKAVEKISNFLCKNSIEPKRSEGILLALAQLCSQLEKSRCQVLSSVQVFDYVVESLKCDSADVRIAACACLKSVSRSVKNLSAGHFARESLVVSLVQLLQDDSSCVQVEALGVICNIVITFSSRNPVFIKLGGIKELVRLSKSMDSSIRLNAVWALRNLTFLADRTSQEEILLELSQSTVASLINDPEASIQEQALALVRNLVGGCPNSIDLLFADHVILDVVARQMHCCSVSKVCTQGMFLLSNISTGSELHKDAVVSYLLQQQQDGCAKGFMTKFLQSTDNLLKTATTWCIINLTNPDSPNASIRASRLHDAGVLSQIERMADDACLDVKYRVRTALQQFGVLGFSQA